MAGLFVGFTYKGARIDREFRIEVDLTEPVVAIDVYGNTCVNGSVANPFVVATQGTTFIDVEVTIN
jgi:hypothetical protein